MHVFLLDCCQCVQTLRVLFCVFCLTPQLRPTAAEVLEQSWMRLVNGYGSKKTVLLKELHVYTAMLNRLYDVIDPLPL